MPATRWYNVDLTPTLEMKHLKIDARIHVFQGRLNAAQGAEKRQRFARRIRQLQARKVALTLGEG